MIRYSTPSPPQPPTPNPNNNNNNILVNYTYKGVQTGSFEMPQQVEHCRRSDLTSRMCMPTNTKLIRFPQSFIRSICKSFGGLKPSFEAPISIREVQILLHLPKNLVDPATEEVRVSLQ
jgi:hypothetical protein